MRRRTLLASALVALACGCDSPDKKTDAPPPRAPAPAPAPSPTPAEPAIRIKGSKSSASSSEATPNYAEDDARQARIDALGERLAADRSRKNAGPYRWNGRAPSRTANGMAQPCGWSDAEMAAACDAHRAALASGRLRLTTTFDSNVRFAYDPGDAEYVYMLDPYWGVCPFKYWPCEDAIGKFKACQERTWPGQEAPPPGWTAWAQVR